MSISFTRFLLPTHTFLPAMFSANSLYLRVLQVSRHGPILAKRPQAPVFDPDTCDQQVLNGFGTENNATNLPVSGWHEHEKLKFDGVQTLLEIRSG